MVMLQIKICGMQTCENVDKKNKGFICNLYMSIRYFGFFLKFNNTNWKLFISLIK